MSAENTQYVNYLIELSQSGRKNAYFDLCSIILRSVFTLVFRIVKDYRLSKKITLAAFVLGWDNIKKYNIETSFVIWLKDFAVRYSMKELEKGTPGISNNQQSKEINYTLTELEEHIFSLPNEERLIFVLHDMEGYSYKEIESFIPDLSIDEIKSKLIATRGYLMSKLDL